MVKKYRALRFVAACARVIAWVILVLGVLAALGAVVVGALQGRVGEPSPLLRRFHCWAQWSTWGAGSWPV
jgi:hypothetical protein